MCGVRPIPGCRMWGAPAVSALGLAVMWRCWTPPGVCPSRHVPPCRTRLPAQVSEPYPAFTCPCPHDGRLGRETAG